MIHNLLKILRVLQTIVLAFTFLAKLLKYFRLKQLNWTLVPLLLLFAFKKLFLDKNKDNKTLLQ